MRDPTASTTNNTATIDTSPQTNSPKRQAFIDAARAAGITGDTITRAQVKQVLAANSNLKWPAWLTGDKTLRAGRGIFRFPTDSD